MSTSVLKPLRLNNHYDYSAVFAAMIAFARAHGGALPSARRLAGVCGVKSGASMAYILARLRSAGLIRMADGVIVIEGARWIPPRRERWADER